MTLVRLNPAPLMLEVQGVWEPLVERQTPLMAKQTFARLIPLAKVEVAVEEVTLRAVVWRPPAKVEVAPLPKIVVVAVVPK